MTGKRGIDPCSVEGCEKVISCKGWCNTHYERFKRSGDPERIETKGRDYSNGLGPVLLEILKDFGPMTKGGLTANVSAKHRASDVQEALNKLLLTGVIHERFRKYRLECALTHKLRTRVWDKAVML